MTYCTCRGKCYESNFLLPSSAVPVFGADGFSLIHQLFPKKTVKPTTADHDTKHHRDGLDLPMPTQTMSNRAIDLGFTPPEPPDSLIENESVSDGFGQHTLFSQTCSHGFPVRLDSQKPIASVNTFLQPLESVFTLKILEWFFYSAGYIVMGTGNLVRKRISSYINKHSSFFTSSMKE